MIRQEALETFEKYKNTLLQDHKHKFWEHLQKNIDPLKEAVNESIRELKEKALHKKDIVYFQFSLLRIDMLTRNYTVLLHAYDNMWYLDEDPVSVTLKINFLFDTFNEVWDQLESESKRYVGKINQYDVENTMFQEAIYCNGLIAHSLRFIIKDIEKNEDFVAISKADLWVIRWGEYRDKSEIVIQRDRRKKDQKDWEKALNTLKEKEDHLVASYWYQVDIKDGECKESQLYFIGFEKSHLTDIDFTQASLLGGQFNECEIKRCQFKGAILREADFRGSHFEEVNFEEADLTNAIFSQEKVPYLNLSPEQLQQIIIEDQM